ncbi:Serpentine Receptor, class BC (Class B-like) [Caenorhabditis elegans]|uniref:Serpentine Receptor, class BC (Class B-like) n=1 Tax=Caenorhabditis elegans TaxID=6239 RepID=O44694_CAEEL|nr:Serpentine Receptor, class BC (Class B-like) [Caenorhabditis elegans]CCD67419.1 Serpentine Receptor, class BC (Class B-like) [Caenorhabditis elegans]|eukprot:NP_503582.1 Serpentine Receptor, class BC (class B-like) [Caenorhabditis elegans]
MEEIHFLKTSAVVITCFGVFFSIFNCVGNVAIIKKMGRRKNDMVLFYFRFLLDVIFGATSTIYLLSIIIFNLNYLKLSDLRVFIFFLGFLISNVRATRALLTMAISIDRVVAVYTPIWFLNYRSLVANSAVLGLTAAFGLSEYPVLYIFCEFEVDIPPKCVSINCALNDCFLQYWTTYKMIIFACTFIFTILLSLKLISKIFKDDNKDLNRANRLTLIDSTIIFATDFLPTMLCLMGHEDLFNTQNMGPFGAVLKQVGCAFEALLVLQTITRRNETTVNSSRTSKTNVSMKNAKKPIGSISEIA